MAILNTKIVKSISALIIFLTYTLTITEVHAKELKYLDTDGIQTTLNENATTVTSSTTSWSDGWYVVSSSTTINNRISVSGTVNLILCNGATLTASNGIGVGSDATFNVYAQSEDEATMGALTATISNTADNGYCARIGGNNQSNFGSITINGGKITATGFSYAAGIGGGYGSNSGNITINGGIVVANAGDYSYSAGIGGGYSGYVNSITLNGGTISATGDTQYGGAGIGTGIHGGSGTMTITITSGVKQIIATKGYNSDCIGKVSNATTAVNVVFKHDNNEVTGDAKNAVFYDTGEGASSRTIRGNVVNHSITISDNIKANVTANTTAAPEGETITLTVGTAVDVSTLKVNDGTNDLTLTDIGNRQYTFVMPNSDVTVTATAAATYSVTLPANMEIVSATNTADGDGKYISGTVVTFKVSFPAAATNVSDGTNTLTADGSGNYSVTIDNADITITATIQRSATIDLSDAPGNFTAINNDVLTGSTSHTVTIADGAGITLSDATITGGIVCEGTADITLVGTNSVSGATNKAGIQIGGSGTTLTIKGNGSLTANGGSQSAGIGLSRAWDVDAMGGDIVIEGGNITATGNNYGAGIGTGVSWGNTSDKTATIGNITIKGGTVRAIGGTNQFTPGSGIGKGGAYSYGHAVVGTITIYDDIDMVNASSISESIVYMHETTDVTERKADYFTIGEDGNRRLIVQKTVIADIPDQTYTGSEITPEPLVIAGSLNLTKGTDYVYSYTNNTNAGTATVRATFKGTYASLGYVEKTFRIIKLLTHSDITIATIPDQTYSGSEICPAVIVNDGETTLILGTDYTVECADNVSAGTANMTITGAGNYVGTVEKTFEIVPKVIHASGAVQVLEDQDGKRAVIDGEYRGDGSVDIPENIKDVSVQFNRTFTVGKYSTIVLPFEIGEDKVMGADFYKIDDINVAIKDGDTTWGPVQISKVTGKIEANTPYLLKPTATRLDFVDAVTLNTSEKHPYGFTKAGVQWEFRGTYHYFDFGIDSTHLVGKSYGFAAKDQPDGLKVGDFRWTSDKSYILPMRGYLVYNEVDENKASKKSPQMRYAPRMSVSSIPETLEVEIVDADGGTTVIGQLDTRTGEIRLNGRMADRWFDMQGRVLKGKPTVKGRYLHNGKIEVIK